MSDEKAKTVELHVEAIVSRLADDKFSTEARWVGVIVANGAIFESELEGVYSAVLRLGYKESKFAFNAIQNFKSRRDTITSAIKHFYSGTEIERAWTETLSTIKKANEIRNRIAHAEWAEDPETGKLQIRRHVIESNGYSRVKDVYPDYNLRNNAEYIARASAQLQELQKLVRSGRIQRKEDDL